MFLSEEKVTTENWSNMMTTAAAVGRQSERQTQTEEGLINQKRKEGATDGELQETS